MTYRGIFEYEYPTEHKPPVSIDVHLHGDCVKGKIIEWEYMPLEQKPKTGHWIKTGDYYTGAYGSIEYVECSCCHEDSLEEGDFCPNCGAKMVESEGKE